MTQVAAETASALRTIAELAPLIEEPTIAESLAILQAIDETVDEAPVQPSQVAIKVAATGLAAATTLGVAAAGEGIGNASVLPHFTDRVSTTVAYAPDRLSSDHQSTSHDEKVANIQKILREDLADHNDRVLEEDHQVSEGETLYGDAVHLVGEHVGKSVNTDVKALEAINHMTDPAHELIAGMHIKLPALVHEHGDFRNYKVKSGDTLEAIADRHHLDLAKLLSINPQFRSDPNLIYPNQEVHLPAHEKHESHQHRFEKETVETGDTISELLIQAGTKPSAKDIDISAKASHIKDPDRIYPEEHVRILLTGHKHGTTHKTNKHPTVPETPRHQTNPEPARPPHHDPKKRETNPEHHESKVRVTGLHHWTPDTDVRSQSGFNEHQINKLLEGTDLAGLGPTFAHIEKRYQINALYGVAHAAEESDWGKSYFAQTRNNLFGIGAYTSDPDHAFTYKTKADCVEAWAKMINENYLNKTGPYYGGGTQLRDIFKHYSTDPMEPSKIAEIINTSLLAKAKELSVTPETTTTVQAPTSAGAAAPSPDQSPTVAQVDAKAARIELAMAKRWAANNENAPEGKSGTSRFRIVRGEVSGPWCDELESYINKMAGLKTSKDPIPNERVSATWQDAEEGKDGYRAIDIGQAQPEVGWSVVHKYGDQFHINRITAVDGDRLQLTGGDQARLGQPFDTIYNSTVDSYWIDNPQSQDNPDRIVGFIAPSAASIVTSPASTVTAATPPDSAPQPPTSTGDPAPAPAPPAPDTASTPSTPSDTSTPVAPTTSPQPLSPQRY